MKDTMPFGKYAGEPIEQVAAKDPQYIDWLMKQDWFSKRYEVTYQLITNHFVVGEQETPEHNALQARFLDKEFLLHLSEMVIGRNIGSRGSLRGSEYYEYFPRQWGHYEVADIKKKLCHRVRFEDGCDVSWEYTQEESRRFVLEEKDLPTPRLGRGRWCDEEGFNRPNIGHYGGIIFCEVKPSLGDEYPATLRQIRQQKIPLRMQMNDKFLLLIGVQGFTTTTVGRAEVEKIFALSGIKLLTLEDIQSWSS